MRIVFIGCVEFSYAILKKLISENANIVGVCTIPESRFNSDHVDLSVLSRLNNIPSLLHNDLNSISSIAWIKDRSPDLIMCFGWSKILSEEILKIPPLGVLGYHPSLLPKNRGRHPLIWALCLGLKITGSTFFFMRQGVDNGPIISQKEILIDELDDANVLYRKMTETALLQISDFLPKLISGVITAVPQDESIANSWRKRTHRDGIIDWRMSAKSIYNLIRALSQPYEGAHFLFENREIKVWHSQIVEFSSEGIEPGKIIDISSGGILVKCGEDSILLDNEIFLAELKIGDYL